jgi:uncharacterized membrane protein YgcG
MKNMPIRAALLLQSLKQCASSILLAFVFFWAIAPGLAEEIKSYTADLSLNKSGELNVTEDIVIDFKGQHKHGLLRFIPVTYNRGAGVYVLNLKLLEVTDSEGGKIQYAAEKLGPDFKIKIGSPDVLVTGVQSYRIKYVVRKAVNFFSGAPELYWNVNGTRWPFPIDKLLVRFHPPYGVNLKDIKYEDFVGAKGSHQTSPIKIENGSEIVATASKLGPGENLSVVFGLPVGSVTQPTALDEFLLFVGDWLGLFVWPAVAGFVLFIYWTMYGRDQQPVSATSVEWTPPADLTPAEVGTLIDESCDAPDMLSTLIDLASRGYLKIKAYPASGFLALGQKNYEFTKTTPTKVDQPLKEHENIFLSFLFPGNMEISTLSELKGTFGFSLVSMKQAIWNELAQKSLFVRNPEEDRTIFYVLAILLIGGGFCIALFGDPVNRANGFGVIVSGVITALSARAMPARTAQGSQALARCKAFQRFVNTAEKRRIALLAKDDPTIFGRLLPYAMVLGAADKWAEAFKDLLVQPPDWYDNTALSRNGVFYPDLFVSDLSDSMHTISSGVMASPSTSYAGSSSYSSWDSTAGSGGSGFDAGGGFSDGGFGGGGGGTW